VEVPNQRPYENVTNRRRYDIRDGLALSGITPLFFSSSPSLITVEIKKSTGKARDPSSSLSPEMIQ
jgi:hypothetical protein